MDKMSEQTKRKTNVHLILAILVSVFSVMLIVVACTLSWEMWMIPLIVVGMMVVWGLRIVPLLKEDAYEYLCTGIILFVLFFYGVHESSLYDMPITMGVFIIMISMLNKKFLLYLSAFTYLLALLYQGLFLHTINRNMSSLEFSRLVLDIIGISSEVLLLGYLIDRRKEEHARERELLAQLEYAKQQNADFLSNISHELRTPINVVTGISGMMLGQELSGKQRENVQSVQLAGMRLLEQIKDILDYTEIAEHSLVIVEERYMMSSILSDLIAAQNKKSNLELVFDMDANMPAVLIGDGEKIYRILKHLLDNAVKFTEEGGVYVHIGFRREQYGINLSIDICDTGIGMAPEQCARICEDFYQADSGYNRKAGGLGLGLSIVRGLLRAIGGFMHIRSKEGQGTQVHITIPQEVADACPSIQVKNPETFCIACYFKADRYERKEVDGYYDSMIRNMAVGLGIEGHRIHHLEELEQLQQNHRLTHLFIGQEEYREKTEYFEEMAKSVCVILIAGSDMTLSEDSKMTLFHKPFNLFPVVSLLNGAVLETDAAKAVQEQPVTCEGVHALVVDDEGMNLVVARGILNSYGMQVDTCLDGEDAVRQCAATAYDIIFLDHMMPGIDGVETLKRIRAIKGDAYQTTPIIALTANAVSGAREMFRNEGFTEFVPKPIERPVLERALRHVLSEQHVRHEKELSPLERLGSYGINTELGMGYCSGSEEFYTEMLKMFCEQSADKKEELATLYDSGDWEAYAVKAHALKSTSLTIGAEALSSRALALEQAGKSGDEALIRKEHSGMLALYEEVCAVISESFAWDIAPKKGEK